MPLRDSLYRRCPRTRATGARCALLLGVLLVAAAAPMLSPDAAEARGSMRCGNRLVNDGDPMDEVFRRCGQPTFRNFSTEYVSFETAAGILVTKEVPIETWTYNRGSREFVRYLKFRDGRLVHITEGNYGY